MHTQYQQFGPQQAPTLLWLHGFMGQQKNWWPDLLNYTTQYSCVTIDLFGHGTMKYIPRPYTFSYQINTLHQYITQHIKRPVTFIGYSMGARIALAYALTYPTWVKQLYLEGAHPGLVTKTERRKRQIQDQQLAQTLIHKGLVSFVDAWEQLPLFASQKRLSPEVQARQRSLRLDNDPIQLARSLRFMGTGKQPNFWPYLSRLNMPVHYICGDLDDKFKRIGKALINEVPNGQLYCKTGVGHNVHLESPDEYHHYILTTLKE